MRRSVNLAAGARQDGRCASCLPNAHRTIASFGILKRSIFSRVTRPESFQHRSIPHCSRTLISAGSSLTTMSKAVPCSGDGRCRTTAAGLVSLFTSKEDFVTELDDFFANSSVLVGAIPNGYYWQGNQPDIHAVYLFNAAGRPDLTQKWVRWILETQTWGRLRTDSTATMTAAHCPRGMSSVRSAFIPSSGTDRYELGSPLWKRAVVNIGDRDAGNHRRQLLHPDHVYVDRVELNGKPLDRWWFAHQEIANGGTLRFVMSDRKDRIIRTPAIHSRLFASIRVHSRSQPSSPAFAMARRPNLSDVVTAKYLAAVHRYFSAHDVKHF